MRDMTCTTIEERRRLASLDRESLEQYQLRRLNQQFEVILPRNRFYAEKLAGWKAPLKSLSDMTDLPVTTKDELIQQGRNGGAANTTFPLSEYVHFHRTSGTRGRPLVVLDTADDWQWWINSWQYVLDAAEVTRDDRVMMAFSFGPFIGFWSAHDAAVARGALVIPGGGMSTAARLDLICDAQATVVLCTPTYALHMAETAAQQNVDLKRSGVRAIIVAGEPGGSVPVIRERIEQAWGAQVIDHSGATEVGPWGFADAGRSGLLVNESEFIVEFLALDSGQPAGEGELSEMVITSLGRYGSPVIRYRSGDLVRPSWQHDDPIRFVLLPGGVLGRVDDMMIIRGVNVFPQSVEQILRGFDEVTEFRMTARKDGEMDALVVEVEDAINEPHRIAHELLLRLGLNIHVAAVPAGSLPRFEGKGKRFVDMRGSG